MAVAEVKNDGLKLDKEEITLATRALSALRASVLRSKVKEISDEAMTQVYNKRLNQIDMLVNKLSSKEMF